MLSKSLMTGKKAAISSPRDVGWISEVKEVCHPITPVLPIIVRRTGRKSGERMEPSVPYPERHPYCELGFSLEGSSLHFIGPKKIRREAGTLLLLGPGVPHYAKVLSYPCATITVHFLPVLLMELGPAEDGAQLLSWIVNVSDYSSSIHRFPPALRRRVAGLFANMAEEHERMRVGFELRLRALLADLLVLLFRRQRTQRRPALSPADSPNWESIRKAFRFIHERYGEAIYAKQIAVAAGVNEARLQVLFRKTVGISPVAYLGAYRITQAKALLCLPGARVIEVASAVGFHTLSHFNFLFRRLVGVPPSEFAKSRAQEGALRARPILKRGLKKRFFKGKKEDIPHS